MYSGERCGCMILCLPVAAFHRAASAGGEMPLSSERQPRRAAVSAQTETATAGARAHQGFPGSQPVRARSCGEYCCGLREQLGVDLFGQLDWWVKWVALCTSDWSRGRCHGGGGGCRRPGGAWSKPGGYVKIVGAIMQILASRLTVAIQIRSICKVTGLFCK
jgi:hypothetical protein